jgi:hypothetical protein
LQVCGASRARTYSPDETRLRTVGMGLADEPCLEVVVGTFGATISNTRSLQKTGSAPPPPPSSGHARYDRPAPAPASSRDQYAHGALGNPAGHGTPSPRPSNSQGAASHRPPPSPAPDPQGADPTLLPLFRAVDKDGKQQPRFLVSCYEERSCVADCGWRNPPRHK